MSESHRVTQLLRDLDGGKDRASEELFALVYDELHALAAARMRHERVGHTLQPTALVNEAYLRLVKPGGVSWENSAHFFAAAAQAIRRILVDHARKKNAQRRGGGREPLAIAESRLFVDQPDVDMLALDDALERLAALDPRQARVVELRFFAGLTMDDVARTLDVSKRTAEGDWTLARAWLKRELSGARDDDG